MNSITSRDLFNIFLKNIFIIILAAIVFASGAFVYCEKFTPEKYRAQGEFLISNGNIGEKDENTEGSTEGSTDGTTDGTTSTPENEEDSKKDKVVANTDVAASINMLPTLRDILKGSDIYMAFADHLAEKTAYTYRYSSLKSAAVVNESEKQSFYFTVSFELGSKEAAEEVTNEFLKFIPGYIESKIEGSRVVAGRQSEDAIKTAPLTSSTVTIAAIFGIIISYVIVFLISILNSTIKSDEDFSARYSIPVIGNIPDFSVSPSNGKSSSKKSQGGK